MDRMERLAELGRERTACIVAFPDAYELCPGLEERGGARQRTGAEGSRDPRIGRGPDRVARGAAHPRAGTATPSLTYTPDPHAAFDAVRNGRADAAVLLNPTKVRDVYSR